MFNLKSEKGSVVVYVLVTMIVIYYYMYSNFYKKLK